MTDSASAIISDESCAVCGHDVEMSTVPTANVEGRVGVKCTYCDAGGDITASGKRTGPVFDGATGAQRAALKQNMPEETEYDHTGRNKSGWSA